MSKLPLPKSVKVSLILPRDRSFSLNPSPKGRVEPWGSVNRKRDKKHQNVVQGPKDHNAPRDRADSRGGGRGRGGRGRGRGGSRGGAVNGHNSRSSGRVESVDLTVLGTDAVDPSTSVSKDENAPSTSAWGSDSTPVEQAHDFSSQAIGTGWSEPTSAWGADTKPNGTPSPAVQAKPLTPAPAQVKPIPRKPGTSNLSWAQVARCAPFYVYILAIFLIRRLARERNQHQHLLFPYNRNRSLPLLHLLVYPNSRLRSKKLCHPRNLSLPYQPLGRIPPLCRSRGKKNPRHQ